MEKIILKATVREELGKSACKHIRKEGRIPGVVYKDGEKALSVHMDSKDLWRALHTDAGENAIITMDITGGSKNTQKTVIVQETQTDPVNDYFLHVDFHEISLEEALKVDVPIQLKGEAPGVTEDKGVLTQIMWEMEVECLPTAIPERIDVNVSELRIGDAVHIKEITPPEGVKFLADPEDVVVTVNLPEKEEEVVEEVVEEGAEAAEPEVIKKGKKEEEEAPEEGAEAPKGGE
jgi:large subunit ribosomal protein L25